jgi:hypothetical protein
MYFLALNLYAYKYKYNPVSISFYPTPPSPPEAPGVNMYNTLYNMSSLTANLKCAAEMR